jgi:hypothetical protein
MTKDSRSEDCSVKCSETTNPESNHDIVDNQGQQLHAPARHLFAPKDHRLLVAQTTRAAGKAKTVAILTLKK